MIKQMVVIKCDICRRKWDFEDDSAANNEWYKSNMVAIRDYGKPGDNGNDYMEYDLCRSCYKKFQDFINCGGNVK